MSLLILAVLENFLNCHFQECMKLVCLPAGTLSLALESLQGQDCQATLEELGVGRMTKEQVEEVIRTRVDLHLE